MNRIILGAVLLAGAVFIPWPAAATAQGLDLTLTPRAGYLTPADWLFEEFKDLGANPMQWTRGVVRKAPMLGLTAQLEVPGTGLWVRGEILGTVDGESALSHTVYTPPSLAGPATTVTTRYVIPSSVYLMTVDLGFPTRLRLPYGVQPYVAAGIGGKTYRFDVDPVRDREDDLVIPRDGTTLVYNVGAGAVVRVFGVGVDVLVRDAISTYWDEAQHDVMVLAGLTWKVF